jgi:hypothetical protein
MFQERLEYVMGSQVRLKTVILRDPVCPNCATGIAETARKADFPAIAALEVCQKLSAFLRDGSDDNWRALIVSHRRFDDGTSQEPLF